MKLHEFIVEVDEEQVGSFFQVNIAHAVNYVLQRRDFKELPHSKLSVVYHSPYEAYITLVCPYGVEIEYMVGEVEK